uniref:Uncharacterized protein n=1 Tax=Oryza sativa subsp. japonica TaxID=39947 RepID=Q5N763_ORYSJ|nr:hypothetical protein [Oryza sativa Japonica Group]
MAAAARRLANAASTAGIVTSPGARNATDSYPSEISNSSDSGDQTTTTTTTTTTPAQTRSAGPASEVRGGICDWDSDAGEGSGARENGWPGQRRSRRVRHGRRKALGATSAAAEPCWRVQFGRVD